MLPAYAYPIALAAISVCVAALERAMPARPDQGARRPHVGWDAVYLVFNGHMLGLILYGLASAYVVPMSDAFLEARGWEGALSRPLAASWAVGTQIVVALLVTDFIHWCVHRLLHRVPWLWELHKCHHSVEDGEMDWLVAFRFQWTEVVVYRVLQYVPLAFFGFSEVAVLFHAVFGTLIGHLNHANLPITWGPLRYVLNSPRMHMWHHDYEGDARSTKNFGIIFSCWDWLFGTAYMPDAPPARIGFPGAETYPRNFFAATLWPAQRWWSALQRPWLATVLGVALIVGAYALAAR